jgi:chemotaxis protein CheZ
MPVRRNVFRIEQMGPVGTPSSALSVGQISAKHRQEILAELKALRDAMERRAASAAEPIEARSAKPSSQEMKVEAEAIQHALLRTKHEIAAMHAAIFSTSGGSRLARELNAIAESAEQATQRILESAESIDDAAKTLAASLQREQERALAFDVQDQVLRIFESCNFQDLHGQRLARVLACLKLLEERIVQMTAIWGDLDSFKESARAAERRERRAGLHGPKLGHDRGHVSQDEVDLIFAAG